MNVLATSIGEKSTERIFGWGKFDFDRNDEPYSGIASVYGQICRKIKDIQAEEKNEGDDLKSRIGSAIFNELKSEVVVF